MDGRRPKAWLPDHRGRDGIIYRRYLRAADALLGSPNGSGSESEQNLRRVEMHWLAVSGVVYE